MKTLTEPLVAASPGASYGFHCGVAGLSFADTVARVTEAPKTEGFGVPTDIGLLLPCNVSGRAQADGSHSQPASNSQRTTCVIAFELTV